MSQKAIAGGSVGAAIGNLVSANPVTGVVIGTLVDDDVMSHAPWGDYVGGWNQDPSTSNTATATATASDNNNESSTSSSTVSGSGESYGGADGNTAPDGTAINGQN